MPSTFVITEACIGVKDATCVEVCPAACIHTTPEAPQYYIDPDVCIACEQCVIVCPVQAIFPDDDLPERLQPYLEINAAFCRDRKAAAPPLGPVQAHAVLDAAWRYVTEAGFSAAIAVVGPDGEPLAAREADGLLPETAQLALDKAYTAAALQVATHQLGRGASGPGFEAPPSFQRDRQVELGGGYPIVEGEWVVGAIGVHGTPGPQTDLQCCMAGLAALHPSSH